MYSKRPRAAKTVAFLIARCAQKGDEVGPDVVRSQFLTIDHVYKQPFNSFISIYLSPLANTKSAELASCLAVLTSFLADVVS